MSYFLETQNPDPELAACYKIFVDLLARMQEAEIHLSIYDSFWIDPKLGPCKTTKLTLWNMDADCELPVVVMRRAFPNSRCQEDLLIESNDHLESLLSLAAFALAHYAEGKDRNVLDCSLRELLAESPHVIRYIDKAYAATQRKLGQ